MTCPTCDGKRVLYAICIKRSDGPSGPGEITCPECKGAGIVPDRPADWPERGRLLREARLARGLSLREEARRRGISVVALSDMELGRSEPKGEA